MSSVSFHLLSCIHFPFQLYVYPIVTPPTATAGDRLDFPPTPLLSRTQSLPHRESDGEMSWLGPEPMHTAAKLSTFLKLSLQEKHVLSLPLSSVMFYLGEKGWGRWRDRLWQLYIHARTHARAHTHIDGSSQDGKTSWEAVIG